ncbi:MAG TPA: hypothetical protein PL051_03780 [Candidatus Saccharibacteria bacterium]|nr:hypothetical protein [Candidatus Saccharibacteria bacterium]HRJ91113.1 hypothetical protein [Candidatus Saccharibacteria bacterium]
MTQPINTPVIITALGFRKGLMAYPKRMEYGGKSYDFIDAGLSCVVAKGGKVIQLLTMTDGISQFKLRSDNRGGTWTLLSMSV